MVLDPATAAMVRTRAAAGVPPLHELTPVKARELSGQPKPELGRGPDVAALEHIDVPAEQGHRVPVDVYIPPGASDTVIVYFHGGGWTVGSAAAWEPVARHLTVASSCPVMVPDYRLAPENPYPAAVDDACTVLRWATESDSRWSSVVLAGDSSGGNLAAVTALRARDAGVPVAAQLLAYPVTDYDLSRPSYRREENQVTLPTSTMAWFWDNYLPEKQRATARLAAPLRANDLEGLPPTVLCTAEHDVLHDEGEAFADRLRAANVPVAYHCFTGQAHGFLSALGLLPAASEGISYLATQLRAALATRDLP